MSSFATLPAIATQDWCDRAAAALTSLHPGISAVVTIGAFKPDGTVADLEATGGAPELNQSSLEAVRAKSLGWWVHSQPADRGAVRTRVLSMTPDHQRWSESAAGMAWRRAGVSDLVVGIIPIHHADENRVLTVELGLPSGAAFDSGRLSLVLSALLPELARRVAVAFGVTPLDPMNRITHREQEVLELLALGKTVKQIAETLSRSPHTVHDHVKSLHRKLRATSRGELVARALGHIDAHPGEKPLPNVVTTSERKHLPMPSLARSA